MDSIKTYFWSCLDIYSGAHISWHKLFSAGNQGNHQNLVPSMLTYNFWLMGMKQKNFFLKKKSKSKCPTQKNWVFQRCQFAIFFRENFRDCSLGQGWSLALLRRPWVSRINWCEEHQCGSTLIGLFTEFYKLQFPIQGFLS